MLASCAPPKPKAECAGELCPSQDKGHFLCIFISDMLGGGSPSRSTLMSPRRCVPLLRFFSWPPSSCAGKASFPVSQ